MMNENKVHQRQRLGGGSRGDIGGEGSKECRVLADGKEESDSSSFNLTHGRSAERDCKIDEMVNEDDITVINKDNTNRRTNCDQGLAWHKVKGAGEAEDVC